MKPKLKEVFTKLHQDKFFQMFDYKKHAIFSRGEIFHSKILNRSIYLFN